MKDTYKGYKLRHYPKSEEHPNADGRYQTFKARPYDDADYWWAYSYDQRHWRVVFQGKRQQDFDGSFEEVVDLIDERNKGVKKKIVHW